MKNERITQSRTKLLYEQDPYLTSFGATVLSCVKSDVFKKPDGEPLYAVELDLTAFFPEGGGQAADEGKLCGRNVYQVQREGGVVYHYIEEELSVGAQVEGHVDYAARFVRMQNHTGEHIVSGLIHSKFGFENIGFHMSQGLVTVDIDGNLSQSDLAEIEVWANEVVYRNIPVEISYPKDDELKTLEYRSKLEFTSNVRIVTIPGVDVCACCAPHVAFTGEIGLIKILDCLPHRGGTRFTMVCGSDAFADYQILHENTLRTMRALSAKRRECADAVERICRQNNERKAEILRLKEEINALQLAQLKLQISKPEFNLHTPYLFFEDEADEVMMRNRINEYTKLLEGMVAGFMGNDKKGYRYIITYASCEEGFDLKAFAREMNEALDGRGGGSMQMIQGSVAAARMRIEAYIKERFEESI